MSNLKAPTPERTDTHPDFDPPHRRDDSEPREDLRHQKEDRMNRQPKMHIEIGHSLTNNVRQVDSNCVRFVAEDGRTMFEVTVRKDGHSIEVRGVETCKVDGILYSEALEIRPRVSNCIEIIARRYDEYWS